MRGGAAVTLLLLLPACASTLDDPTPYVDTARVLAVRVDPAEAEPGEEVTFQALYADSTGPIDTAGLAWSFCTAARPLAELGPVATTCLDPDSPDLAPFSDGVAAIPDDTCSLFGPNPPASADGTAAGRPVDPDVTGGFYQPALAFDGDAPTLVPVRTRCGLANVTQETYVAWNSSYTSNVPPTVTLDLPTAATPGESLSLSASWPTCDDAAPCDGAESYVVYDPDTRKLATRREAMSASWFATSGTFDLARNGRDSDEEETSVENTWTAPERGEAWIWVVIRDDRGGVGFVGGAVTVGG